MSRPDIAADLEAVQRAVGRAIHADEVVAAGRMLRAGRSVDDVAATLGARPDDIPDADLHVDAAVVSSGGAIQRVTS